VAFGRALGVARSRADLLTENCFVSAHPGHNPSRWIMQSSPEALGSRVRLAAIVITDAPAGAFLTGLRARTRSSIRLRLSLSLMLYRVHISAPRCFAPEGLARASPSQPHQGQARWALRGLDPAVPARRGASIGLSRNPA
jgi:hypothetical protein